jgi:putative membrane protein
MQPPVNHLVAFLIRLALSAALLWLGVAWVSPKNPHNTFGRAVLVSLVLSFVFYITLVHWFWWLIIPWLIYVCLWLAVIMGSYDLGFFRALLLALALTFLSWLAANLLGVLPLPS